MLKKLGTVLLMVSAFTVHADDVDFNSVANNMYATYIEYDNGVAAIMGAEENCWKNVNGNLTAAETCIASTLAGAIIEAAYARQELRSSAPNYQPDAMRERILKNMANAGFTESQTDTATNYVHENADKVIAGLFNAGMR
jgi:hypothetical protein